MSLKRTGDWDKIPSILPEQFRRIEKAIVFNFHVVGEKSVKHARDGGSYKDQTTNLRNSIGYVVAYNGQIIEEVFKNSSGITDSEAFRAKYKIQEMLGDSGYTLIVVAGMNYARHVENMGYNVLTKTEHFMQDEVKRKVKDILKKAGF